MTKIAFLGGGLAVRDLHIPALERLDELSSIAYVATSNMESSSKAAAEFRNIGVSNVAPASVDEVLHDSSVSHVLVAVPISATAHLVRRAIAAGKHVLAEKPISDNHAESLALLDEAKRAGVKLLAGENFRFQNTYRDISQLITDGLIGAVKVVFWNDLHFTLEDSKYAATQWRITGNHPGGYLIDGGTHIVAGLRQLRSVQIQAVHAVAASVQPYLSNQSDTLLINLRYEDGVVGHLALGYGVHDPDARRPKILGTDGTLILRNDGVYLVNSEAENKVLERDSDPGFASEWESFLDISNGSLAVAYQLTKESADDLAVITAARLSAESRREVTVEY